MGKADGILRNGTVWLQQQQQASGKGGREHSVKKTGGEDLRLLWGGVWNWIRAFESWREEWRGLFARTGSRKL